MDGEEEVQEVEEVDEAAVIMRQAAKMVVRFLAIVVGISVVMGGLAWLVWFSRALWGLLF